MNEQQTDAEGFEGFAVLEVMGHRRLGGYVREVALAGAGFLRIDVPDTWGLPPMTQFYSPSSIYCLTPTTEEIAKAAMSLGQPEPVQRWELPKPEADRATEEIRADDLYESECDPEDGDDEAVEGDW